MTDRPNHVPAMFRKGTELTSGVRILGRDRRRHGPFRILHGGHRIELAIWRTCGEFTTASMLPPNCEPMRGEGDVYGCDRARVKRDRRQDQEESFL